MHIGINKNKILFILCTSKIHWKDNKLQMVKITSQALQHSANLMSINNWLFEILRDYLRLRPTCCSREEPFFIFLDRSTVKPDHLQSTLKLMIKQIGCIPECYNTMSLHAGQASDLLDLGISVEMIRKLGSWKSNAVFTYLQESITLISFQYFQKMSRL